MFGKLLSAVVAVCLVSYLSAQDDVGKKINDALKKSSEMKSCTFKSENKMEGGNQQGGQGGRGPTGPTEAKWSADDGMVGKSGETEFARVGDKSVTKDSSGNWKKPDTSGGGQGGRGGRGGRGGFGGMRGANPPAEYLKSLVDGVKDAKAGDKENDCETYTGTVSEDGMKKLSSVGRPQGGDNQGGRGGNRGGFGGGTGTGEVKVWVNGDGWVAKIQITTKMKIPSRDGGDDREFTMTRTIEISDCDNTKVEIPAEAKKALSD